MDMCVCDITALECIRLMGARDGRLVPLAGDVCVDVPKRRVEGSALLHLLKCGASAHRPLDVLAPEANRRMRAQGVHAHVWSGPYPPGSFIDLGQGIACLSPCALFTRMAKDLPFAKRILLAYELAGCYAIVPNPEYDSDLEQQGFVNRAYRTRTLERRPLASISELVRYAAENSHLHGSRAALEALRYALDGAASPLESRLALITQLPQRLGGYELGEAVLNYRVDTDESYRKIDVYLPHDHVGLEADSRAHHGTLEAIERDSARRNSLLAQGISMVNISTAEMEDPLLFHEVMRAVYKLQHREFRIRSTKFEQKRDELWAVLFPWSRCER